MLFLASGEIPDKALSHRCLTADTVPMDGNSIDNDDTIFFGQTGGPNN